MFLGGSSNCLSGRPLQQCSLSGQVECAELLIEFGADVNSQAVFTEYTPLHYAAQGGQTEIIQLLCKMKANTNAQTHVKHTERKKNNTKAFLSLICIYHTCL